MAVRRSREEWKTYKNVFDNHSIVLLERMRAAHIFDEIVSPIALGKEANVFLGLRKNEPIAIKIYRLENCNFNKMWEYIRQDPRYQTLKHNRRGIIFAWTQREFRNLGIAKKFGVRVPTPYECRDNILLMSWVGTEQEAAPQLKDSAVEDREYFFNDLIEQYKLLAVEGGLVHGDASDFNTLVLNDDPWLIDMSQSMPTDSFHAKEILIRDLTNLTRAASKRDIDIGNPEDIANEIIKLHKQKKGQNK